MTPPILFIPLVPIEHLPAGVRMRLAFERARTPSAGFSPTAILVIS